MIRLMLPVASASKRKQETSGQRFARFVWLGGSSIYLTLTAIAIVGPGIACP
jgi:hypothetical protein